MRSIPEMALGSTGKDIPLVGMGTAVYPFAPSEAMIDSILTAIELEKPLGETIKKAVELGLIKSRNELFITSKLWWSDAHHDRVLPALQNTLKNLQLDYLDLYLIHWPVSLKPGKYELPVNKDDLLPIDLGSVWKAMEDCQKLGLTKAIGVNNFSCKKLEELLQTASILPAVNQVGSERGLFVKVEMNPLWQQKKLREFCAEKGIHITAYSPLGAKGTLWGTDRVMECEVLKEIARETGKSIAQVCLRWVYEQGVSLLVKSFNKERIKQNLEIFDWELSAQDLEKIIQIPQFKGFPGVEFVCQTGPYKSLVDLWDGEI
ncbi:hypothetical protein PVL29_000603 [Vitis rotundifolia]|uniref:NADP-dependent oxidoreductase domain-containing protein n=1 Tax=Vitis rotundifolia TaxID=103349 RepID=A0AA39AM09_VITRO|nr:hypothetical protein PVL29_000603 [Vitis rotundifolia]